MSAVDKQALGLPSRHVTEGLSTALNRIFFHAMGVGSESIARPVVGVVSSWHSDARSAALPLELAGWVEGGVWAAGGLPRKFATIADDAEGRDPGFLGRELIADSVELTVRGHSQDGLVGVAASEAAIAGQALAICRLDVPGRIVPLLGTRFGSTPDAHALARALESLGLVERGDEPEAAAAAAGRLVCGEVVAGVAPRSRIDRDALIAAARVGLEAGGGPALLVHLVALASEVGVALDLADLVTAAGGPALRWVTGAIAPEGAIVAGARDAPVCGHCLTFAGPEQAVAALADDWPAETVVVIRGQGPVGTPGARRMVAAAEQLATLDRPADATIVTDGLLASLAGVTVVCAVGPEAAVVGPIGRLRDGDGVLIDPQQGVLDGTPTGSGDGPAARAAEPVRQKYQRLVSSLRDGAVTHPGAAAEVVRYPDL